MNKNKTLHLDVKPENLMINNKGKLITLDFGMSKTYESDKNGNII